MNTTGRGNRMRCHLRIAVRDVARCGLLAVSLLGGALLAGCSLLTEEDAMLSDDVSLSPIAVMLPRQKVISSANAFAEERPRGFVFVSPNDDMLPRYTPGTAFVAERADYHTLRPGMTVIFNEGQLRVARALMMKTSEGWITRGFNAAADDPNFMTEANYVGTVIMAFSPDAAPQSK